MTAEADGRLELTLRLVAPPACLLASWWMVSSATGRGLVRTLFTMWIHELGHAAASWLCGRFALPGPWITFTTGGHSALVVAGVAVAFGWVVWRGWTEERGLLTVLGIAGLATQLVGTLLPARSADALITFAGDGGALVIATLLFATTYARQGSRFRHGALRWGLLFIGTAAFADVFTTWLAARIDIDAVPLLGEIDGVGLSDASKLMQVHGWGLHRLIVTYVALGAGCLGVMVALYAAGLREARRSTVRGAVPHL